MSDRPIQIVADAAIPFAQDAFSRLGTVIPIPGRQIDAAAVRDADALVVRTITPVGESLLAGSRVRFVGTATIGFDHVDVGYLQRAGIGFATAAGCNATSVAEYVITALLQLAVWRGWSLGDKTLGVIGVGNCGSRVVPRAEALGMTVLQNDPPLARQTGERRFRPIEELLEHADVLTYHVPLSREGPDATFHMIDANAIGRMKAGAVVLNASRGPVHDTAALTQALADGRLAGAVVDTWEDEPNIDLGLLERVFLGTPHVAGYSRDGKAGGTAMMFEALRGHFGVEACWDPQSVLPPPPHPQIEVAAGRRPDEDVLAEVTATVYDIRRDDAALRRIAGQPAERRGACFDRLRAEYPVRREFRFTTVHCPDGGDTLRAKLQGLGFLLG
jgi:erythronate-4-phosphate dehydrogenase